MTTSTSCDLVVAAVTDVNDTATISSPWKTEASYTSGFPMYVIDNLPSGASAGSAVNAQATLSSSDRDWVVGEMAFRAAATTAPAQPTKLAFTTSVQTDTSWTCSSAVTVQAQNGSGTPTNTSTGLYVNLSGTGMSYFQDPNCQYPITTQATPALVASTVSDNSSGALTTSPINTTGATLLVAAECGWCEPPGTLSDSNNNTWHPLTEYGDSGVCTSIQMFYSYAPTTSTNHTFTNAGTGYNSLAVMAFSGTLSTSSVYDASTGGKSTSPSFQPGNIAPSQLGELVTSFACSGSTDATTGSVSSPFTLANYLYGNANGSNAEDTGSAYWISTSEAQVNPSWTFSGDSDNVAAIATFKTGATGVPSVLIGAGTDSATYYFESAAPADNTVTTSNVSDTAGLLAWWKLDDGSGTSAVDSSGNGHTGTLVNSPTWTTGMLNGALGFNGTNQYVNFGNVTALGGLSAITVSGWVKSTSAVETHIADKSACVGTANTGSWELLFGGNPGPGIPQMCIYPPGLGAYCAYNESGAKVNDGQWHLLTGTWDGVNLDVYADGVLQGTETSSFGMYAGTQVVDIGGYCNGDFDVGPETVDDVRVYNRALSAAEIASVMSDRGLATVSQTETVSVVPYTWIGGTVGTNGCDGNWTTGACWQGGNVPSNGNIAHFDGNCTSNCSPAITGPIDVGGIWMHTGYSGSISPGTNNVTVENSFEEDGGTFTGSSGTFLDEGSFTLTGGTFTAGSGPLTFDGGNVLISGGTFTSTSGTAWDAIGNDNTFVISGSASFNANGGIFLFGDPASDNNLTIVVPASAIFNNVTFQAGNDSNDSLSGTMSIGGSLTFDSNPGSTLRGGTFAVRGGVTATSGPATGSTLELVGSGNQTVSSVTGGGLPESVVIASTGGTVTFTGNFDPIYNWTYVSGTVNMGTTTIPFGNPSSGNNVNITSGSMVFNNVTFQGGNSSWATVTGTMSVGGNLALNNSNNDSTISGGTVSLAGNLSVSSGAGGNAGIGFTGSGTQTYTRTGGTMPTGPITVTGGAPALVQSNAQGGGSLSSLAYTSNVTKGNLLVVGLNFSGATSNTNAPTDTLGNTWVDSGSGCVRFNTGNGCLQLFYVLSSNASGADTLTLPTSSSGGYATFSATIYEFSWNGPAGTLDVVQANAIAATTAGTGNETTGSDTTTGADLIIGYFSQVHGPDTVGAGFTSPNGDINGIMEYLNQSGPGSIAALVNDGYGSGDPYGAILASFKPSGGTSGGLQLLSDMPLSNGQSLNVVAGTLDLNSHNLTGSPALAVSNNATVEAQGGETVTATETFGTGSTAVYYGTGDYSASNLALGNTYGNLSFTGSGGKWMSNAALTVNGNVSANAGQFAMSASNATLNGNLGVASGATFSTGGNNVNLQGNLTDNGTFTCTTGCRVKLNSGSSHAISGSSTFYNLTMDDSGNTAADTLTFQNGSTQTVTGTLTLNGNTTHNLKLRSDSTGTQWLVNPSSSSVTDVDVEDSDNTNATAISANGASVNSGNNTNWAFNVISLVQQATGSWSSGTTYTVTLSTAPTNGNVVVLGQGVSGTSANNTISSISQTGVTWHKATSSHTNDDSEIWYGEVGSGASTTVTVTLAWNADLRAPGQPQRVERHRDFKRADRQRHGRQ